MKKIIALAAVAAVYSGSVLAGNFEGWSVSGSAEQAKSTLSGAPVMQADGTQTMSGGYKISTLEGSDSVTGIKLGAAYGMFVGSTLTTFGADYSTSKASVVNKLAGNGVAGTDPNQMLTTDVKNRIDLYVAPGLMIDAGSLAYAKVGYSTFGYSVTHGDPSKTVSGQPGKNGLSYGIGYKQVFNQNSPYFFTAEYMTGKTGNADIKGESSGNTLSIATNNKFSSLSLGIGYSFK